MWKTTLHPLTRPVLENGLALKIAQQEERQIAEALSASQDYLGSLMVNVANDAMDSGPHHGGGQHASD